MDFIVTPNRIYLENEAGEEIAYVTLEGTGAVWDLTHTVVDGSLRGQGVAAKLVDAAVEEARKQGKKINPVCSYAQKKFDEVEAYRDMRA